MDRKCLSIKDMQRTAGTLKIMFFALTYINNEYGVSVCVCEVFVHRYCAHEAEHVGITVCF